MTTTALATIERHLAGVRSSKNEVEVAPNSRWSVMSGALRHPMSAPLAYRFIMQAWDFPLSAAKLSDAGAGHINAELTLDNGDKYQKIVLAEYQVSEGLIVEATLHDAEVVLKHG